MFEDYRSKSQCIDLILGALERGDPDLLVTTDFSKFGWVTAPIFEFEVWGMTAQKQRLKRES